MTEALIRAYNPEDKSFVLNLFDLNSPEFFHPDEKKDLEHYLEYEIESFYVVLEAGEIVGCGGFNLLHEGAEARISWDFFHPASRGKGLGKKLVEFRLSKLRSYPTVKNIVVRTSQFAHEFYAKCGFVLTETIENYWAPGFHLYRMEFPSKTQHSE